MELEHVSTTPSVKEVLPSVLNQIEVISTGAAFIEANTISGSLDWIKYQHIIPVFTKDNEPVISHAEFIEAMYSIVKQHYHGEVVLKPNIRLSHPIKGRVPEARNKPANELLDHEKTLYYERMAFVIEVPSIYTDIDGNRLNLCLGGVKAYNLDNLNNKLGSDQHFKVFAGFKNLVCTNLCVSTDGYMSQLKVKTLEHLHSTIGALIGDFNAFHFAQQLSRLQEHSLTEKQFVNLIGRCRMYRFMPEHKKQGIQELYFGDAQINSVCKDYYLDNSFCSDPDGNISLWKLYNLFTGANKSTYIDSFLDRSVNAFQLSNDLFQGLQDKQDCWFLN